MHMLLVMGSGAHDSALGSGSAGMMMSYAGHVSGSGGSSRNTRTRVVRPRHGRSGGRIPVGGLGHLATRCEIPIRTGHISQTCGVHPGGGRSRQRATGRVESRLIQIRVVHDLHVQDKVALLDGSVCT